MFSRPVSSGWKPVPTLRQAQGTASSREPTRPWISACQLSGAPSVGSVMRESILSPVLSPVEGLPMRLVLSLSKGIVWKGF